MTLRERIAEKANNLLDAKPDAMGLGPDLHLQAERGLELARLILALLDEPEPVETTDERQARIMLGALTAFAQKWELAEAALDWIEEGEDG